MYFLFGCGIIDFIPQAALSNVPLQPLQKNLKSSPNPRLNTAPTLSKTLLLILSGSTNTYSRVQNSIENSFLVHKWQFWHKCGNHK